MSAAVVGKPVPFKVAVSVGFAVVFVVTVSVPVCAPAVVGVNVTLMVQVAPAANVVVQVLLAIVKPAVTAAEFTAMATPEVLVTVKVCTAETPPPAYVLAKVADVGVSVAVVSTPFPVSDTVNVGLLVESFVMVSVAVRVPFADGVNVTVTVQVEPSDNEVQVLVCVKSLAFVPLRAIFEMVTVLMNVVVFVTVAVCDAEWPRYTSPKLMLVGDTEAVVGTGGIAKFTRKPSCGVRPAGVVALFPLVAA